MILLFADTTIPLNVSVNSNNSLFLKLWMRAFGKYRPATKIKFKKSRHIGFDRGLEEISLTNVYLNTNVYISDLFFS